MIIKSYGPMTRQGSDLSPNTSLLVNFRPDGANRSRLKTIPGYSVNDTSVAIDGGGTVVRGQIYSHKDESGNEYIFMISADKLYYLKSDNKWYLVDWDGEETANFDKVRFWVENNNLHIGAGADGVSAVYRYLKRLDADGTGYFGDPGEDFTGYHFGEAELPKFIASEHIAGITSYLARLRKTSVGDYLEGFGVSPKTSNFLLGQFVYEGGQVSIPSADSIIPISGLVDDAADETFFSIVEIILNQDVAGQVGYDKRLIGIDFYVAELSADGMFNTPVYPDIFDERGENLDRYLSETEYSSLPWKWLTRVRLNGPTVIYQGVFIISDIVSATVIRWTKEISPAVSVDDDVVRNNFCENNYLNGYIAQYSVEVRPIDESGDWEELDFDGFYAGTTSGGGTQFVNFQTGDKPTGSALSDRYECRIISKWTKSTDSLQNKHKAGIQVIDFSSISPGESITINSTVLVAGTDWTAATSNYATGQSIAAALALAGYSSASQEITHYGNYHTAMIEILSDASFTLSSTVDKENLVLGSKSSYGGFTEDKWKTSITINRAPSSEQETGDLMSVAQPYSLSKEYHPQYEFAALQNRRSYYYDCTTRKRYRNMLMWSEINRPEVIPNRNYVFLNTKTGEESRGLVQINNGLLALSERTMHLIRMTGEPIQYDEEENVFDVGCLSSLGVIEVENVAYWPGFDGLKKFDNGIGDLTLSTFMDDYKAIVKSEYTNNSSSYEDIVAGYSAKERMIVWSFPNSTHSIGLLVIKMIAYDLRTGEIFLLHSPRVFSYFTTNIAGELLGVDIDDGIYNLFSESPSETNSGLWTSGVLAGENTGIVKAMTLRIRYKGTVLLTASTDGNQVLSEVLPAKSSIGFETRQVPMTGEGIQLQVETSSTTTVDVLDRIEVIDQEIPR